MRTLVAAIVIALPLLAGCSGADEEDTPSPGPAASSPVELDEELSDELVEMQKQDQGQPSTATTTTDTDRIARLKEIIAEHGWPTLDLVGKDGEDAAWLIAQHADVDPDFQVQALGLLREAVAEGQASPGNLAYLEDRVRAARDQPQLYGTQTGCTRAGKPGSPEIEDPDGLDERRDAAGLPPYDRYLKQMERLCRS